MKATLVIAAALLAAASGALWLRPDSARSTAPPPVAERDSPLAATALVEAETGAAPSANAPDQVPTSTAAANEQGASELARAMADAAHDKLGPRFVDYLVEQGLARADSEIIVAELMRDLTGCGFDALREQALAQGLAFGELLDAVEAAFHDADGPDVTALVDLEAVRRREMPCSLTVLQQAGIPPTEVPRLIRQPR